MNEKGYISMLVVLILLVTGIFSSNILSNINNEIKVVGLEQEKHRIKNNRYNGFLETISEKGFVEKEILEQFKDERPLSQSIRVLKDGKIYILSFYKDRQGIVKLKVKENDKKNNGLIDSYGKIIRDVFKGDIIRIEKLSDLDREFVEDFIGNLSLYKSSYIGHYEFIEDIEDLNDNMMIKYIEGDLNISKDLEIEGILIVNGQVQVEEDINLIIDGKLICRDITETGYIEVDDQKYDILLSYSKYIPDFLEYRPEVIKVY